MLRSVWSVRLRLTVEHDPIHPLLLRCAAAIGFSEMNNKAVPWRLASFQNTEMKKHTSKARPRKPGKHPLFAFCHFLLQSSKANRAATAIILQSRPPIIRYISKLTWKNWTTTSIMIIQPFQASLQTFSSLGLDSVLHRQHDSSYGQANLVLVVAALFHFPLLSGNMIPLIVGYIYIHICMFLEWYTVLSNNM